MDEEENQEYRIGCRKCDASDNVNGLGHTDRMRWLFLAYLYETCLEIVLILKDDLNIYYHLLAITSVAHPLLAEWVQGLVPPHVVQATISFGPAPSRFCEIKKNTLKCRKTSK